MSFYHGGAPGLSVGDTLVPSPPPVFDGCPICIARAEGRAFTVGEMRAWATTFGDQGRSVIEALEGAADNMPIDPPSAENAVYVTTVYDYALWYAARSAGDLYRVQPIGRLTATAEDHFPSFTTSSARIVEVIRRGIKLTRHERRSIQRQWVKADKNPAVTR